MLGSSGIPVVLGGLGGGLELWGGLGGGSAVAPSCIGVVDRATGVGERSLGVLIATLKVTS